MMIIKRINPKKYIYVSYSSYDKDTANRIVATLGNQLERMSKYRFVILTADSISYGENMQEAIQKFINSADIVIILVSEGYLNSKWCMREFKVLNDMGKKIIPVVTTSFDDLEKMSNNLKEIKALSLLDCDSETDFENKLSSLAKDLIKQRQN